MIKIDKLANGTALRTWATSTQMADAVKQIVEKALTEDLVPHVIEIDCSSSFETSGEYHIVLWAD